MPRLKRSSTRKTTRRKTTSSKTTSKSTSMKSIPLKEIKSWIISIKEINRKTFYQQLDQILWK